MSVPRARMALVNPRTLGMLARIADALEEANRLRVAFAAKDDDRHAEGVAFQQRLLVQQERFIAATQQQEERAARAEERIEATERRLAGYEAVGARPKPS